MLFENSVLNYQNEEKLLFSTCQIPHQRAATYKVFDNAPIPSTGNQVFAAFRAQLTRKDNKRVANLSKPAISLSQKTANLNGRKTRLIERLRKTLDPKSLYSPNSNVLVIARDMNRNFKRVNNKLTMTYPRHT